MILTRRDGAKKAQKYFVYFKKPADVREMVFMVWNIGVGRRLAAAGAGG